MSKKPVKEKSAEDKGQFFVIITDFKEIFAGWSKDDPKADIITLTEARMVVYYSADTKGLIGLAAKGPGKDSRISGSCPQIVVRRPVNVLVASQAAIDRFGDVLWK